MVALALLGLVAPESAAAEIRWNSGARPSPAPMEAQQLLQSYAELGAPEGVERVIVHLSGPPVAGQREALLDSGVRLLSYLGSHAYFATLTDRLDPERAARVAGTIAIEPIEAEMKLHPDLIDGSAPSWSSVSGAAARAAAPISDPAERVAVYVLFHRDVDFEAEAAQLLARHDGILISRIESLNGAVAHLPLGRLRFLAAADPVMYVEPPLPLLESLNSQNSARTGADVVADPPYNLDGSGVTALVYDGGRVFAHSDLAGRLTVGPSDTSGTSDHATHVACTVGGAGAQNTGMAPATQIISYGFEQPGGLQQGFLYTDPGDLEADYTQAIGTFGADISNNSIGTNTAQNGYPCSWEGNYGVTGALIDEIVRGSLGQPMRVVWANGNERGNGSCGVQYQTTAPPACAKNSLTVGALNSNDDSVTSFTSWGPCDDGRLKPDVSAPGCQSGGDGGVTSCSSSGGYNVKCGTSMAAPTVTGLSSLLLQHYRASFPTRPDFRNSTLRAVLAQTAVDLGNPGPDYQTGYGSVRIAPAVDLIGEERFLEDQISQSETYTFSLNVQSAGSVKVTLAWDDPAGTPDVNPVLVNDLDLRIVGPGNTTYFPWTLNPASPATPAVQTVRDGLNNIEQVSIANAAPGVYSVEVSGFSIAEGPTQPFSIAASHPPVFCFSSPTFGGLLSATPGDSCGEIDLTWAEGQTNCDPAGQITYNVYRSFTPLALPTPSTLVHQGISGTSFTDAGLEPGQNFFYLVRADDSASGEDANFVKLSATTPITPDTGAPLFSGLGSAVAGPACGEVLLDWGAAVESCSAPVYYNIYRSTDPGFVAGPESLLGTTFESSFVDAAVQPGSEHSYIVRAVDAAGNIDPNNVRRAVTPSEFDLTVFATPFESGNAAWSVVDPDDATTGSWEWGNPTGTAYQPEDDATELGVNCWITGLAAGTGNNDIDDGTTTLLSAQYDAQGLTNPAIRYSRWFTNDRGGSPGDATDTLRVDVSNDDGQSWTPLEVVGAGTPLDWVDVALPLPIAGTDQMRVRLTASDLGAGSLVEAGIDEFSIVDAGQACNVCTVAPSQTLCEISVSRSGDDIVVDWSENPVGARAVVYDIDGCGPGASTKLGTTTSNSFVHVSAALTAAAFNYRVTFVDACGNEQAFCGTADCP